jgi:hypothetical protein
MIVVDPHAFNRLWPILGVWLFLFVTAGDGVLLARRQYVLLEGKKDTAILAAKNWESVPMIGGRRMTAYFRFTGANGRLKTAKESVGVGRLAPEPAVHVLGDQAYLDDDLGYSRWKLVVFGGSFAALWLWALGRYRFG